MKYAHFAFHLKLHKRIQEALFYIIMHKCLAEVKAILEEANHPSFNINEYSDYASNFKVSIHRLLLPI